MLEFINPGAEVLKEQVLIHPGHDSGPHSSDSDSSETFTSLCPLITFITTLNLTLAEPNAGMLGPAEIKYLTLFLKSFVFHHPGLESGI